jgi:hypothetical protein
MSKKIFLSIFLLFSESVLRSEAENDLSGENLEKKNISNVIIDDVAIKESEFKYDGISFKIPEGASISEDCKKAIECTIKDLKKNSSNAYIKIENNLNTINTDLDNKIKNIISNSLNLIKNFEDYNKVRTENGLLNTLSTEESNAQGFISLINKNIRDLLDLKTKKKEEMENLKINLDKFFKAINNRFEHTKIANCYFEISLNGENNYSDQVDNNLNNAIEKIDLFKSGFKNLYEELKNKIKKEEEEINKLKDDKNKFEYFFNILKSDKNEKVTTENLKFILNSLEGAFSSQVGLIFEENYKGSNANNRVCEGLDNTKKSELYITCNNIKDNYFKKDEKTKSNRNNILSIINAGNENKNTENQLDKSDY